MSSFIMILKRTGALREAQRYAKLDVYLCFWEGFSKAVTLYRLLQQGY